jgi:hypothetical protein
MQMRIGEGYGKKASDIEVSSVVHVLGLQKTLCE